MIRDDVLESIRKNGARGVVFDLSSVRLIDGSEFNGFVELGRMSLMLGAEAVFMGIRPGVVSSLIDIGIEDVEIKSFLNINAVLDYFGPEETVDRFPEDEEEDEMTIPEEGDEQ